MDFTIFVLEINDRCPHPYLVYVPDLQIFTEGDSFYDAVKMAKDAITTYLLAIKEKNLCLPIPSNSDEASEKIQKYQGDIDFKKAKLVSVCVDI